jgi:BirA family biotin operon repressor/biotin-[acetyl-CoA-carboxylase] ligase
LSTDPAIGGAGGWPEGYARIVLDETDSTLDEARRRLPELSGPAWILARHQTAARGRRGRPWRHPPGNFAATLVLPRPGAPEVAAQRSFAAALALQDALAPLAPAARWALKWPNDVLLNGGKLAGILLEGLPDGALAVGIGVNLAQAPQAGEVEPGALRPVSLAQETGALVGPAAFLSALATAYAPWEDQLTTQGFPPLKNAWLARAARLGEAVTVRLPTETLEGRFETLDDSGRLVLATPRGPRAIAAGDVFF